MTFLADLWARRDDAEVIVASRYVDRSRVNMPAARTIGSRILNSAFRRGLSVGVNDGSSAIRLYRTSVVNSLQLESTDYDILQDQISLSLLELDTIQNYKHNPTLYVELIGNALYKLKTDFILQNNAPTRSSGVF